MEVQHADIHHPHPHPHHLAQDQGVVPPFIVASPLELSPLQAPRPVQRSRCITRGRDEGLPHISCVLLPSPWSTANHDNTTWYAFDRLLVSQEGKGVSIFLAAPVVVPSGQRPPPTNNVPCSSAATTLPPLSPLASSVPPASTAAPFLPSAPSPACQATPSSPSLPCVVSCGGPVVIKVALRPQHPSRQAHLYVDDPLVEIAAYHHLMQRHHQHPNLLPLLDCLQDDDFVYLVFPYLAGGDLFSRVHARRESGGLSEAEAYSFFRKMCEGLLFMKETSRLAHHDVSLENVMLAEDHHERGGVKVIDLGMCLRVPPPPPPSPPGPLLDDDDEGKEQAAAPLPPPVYLTPQPCHGKPSYLSPELVRQGIYDPFAADVWSLGVCLYILCTGHPLYASPHDQAFDDLASGRVREVVAIYETHGLRLSPLAKDLVCRMLDGEPTRRPTLEEVLGHPFMVHQYGRGAARDPGEV